MIWFQCTFLLLVAAAGTIVVATRELRAQALVFGFFSLLLSILFLSLQAPDVAYSEIVVGSAAIPFMILAAIKKTEGKEK